MSKLSNWPISVKVNRPNRYSERVKSSDLKVDPSE